MGIVLTNGQYYIVVTKGGGVDKTPHLSQAKVFPNVNLAMERLRKAPAKTKGYYPYDPDGTKTRNNGRRTHISQETRRMVYDRAGGCCALCGKHLLPDDFTVDHIVPVVFGGADDVENLQLACFGCNQLKGRMHQEELMEMVENIFLHQMTVKGRIRGTVCRMMVKGL